MLHLEAVVDSKLKILVRNFSRDPEDTRPGMVILHRGFDGLYLYKKNVLDEVVENCWSTFFKYYAPNLFGKACFWDDINENVVYEDVFFEAAPSTYVGNTYGYYNDVLAAVSAYRAIEPSVSDEEVYQLLNPVYPQDSYDVGNIVALKMDFPPVIYLFTSKR